MERRSSRSSFASLGPWALGVFGCLSIVEGFIIYVTGFVVPLTIEISLALKILNDHRLLYNFVNCSKPAPVDYKRCLFLLHFNQEFFTGYEDVFQHKFPKGFNICTSPRHLIHLLLCEKGFNFKDLKNLIRINTAGLLSGIFSKAKKGNRKYFIR